MAETKEAGITNWQPIASAPKDGRHVLAHCVDYVDEYDEDNRLIAKGKPEPSIVVAYQVEWLGGIVQYPWNGGLVQNRRYTHWQPLPSPPPLEGQAMTMSDLTLPVSVEAVRELPEEIARAIDALEDSAQEHGWEAGNGSAENTARAANERRVARNALTTAILSRLTAAEASRDVALVRVERLEKALPYISAQLRHAYAHLINGRATDLRQFADGLLAPQIKRLEALSDPSRPDSKNDPEP